MDFCQSPLQYSNARYSTLVGGGLYSFVIAIRFSSRDSCAVTTPSPFKQSREQHPSLNPNISRFFLGSEGRQTLRANSGLGSFLALKRFLGPIPHSNFILYSGRNAKLDLYLGSETKTEELLDYYFNNQVCAR